MDKQIINIFIKSITGCALSELISSYENKNKHIAIFVIYSYNLNYSYDYSVLDFSTIEGFVEDFNQDFLSKSEISILNQCNSYDMVIKKLNSIGVTVNLFVKFNSLDEVIEYYNRAKKLSVIS